MVYVASCNYNIEIARKPAKTKASQTLYTCGFGSPEIAYQACASNTES